MNKTITNSSAFKENIRKILAQKNTSQNLITTGKIIRDIGQECFKHAPTNVWGKTNELEKKMALLNDEKINLSNGLLVLGYGDAENNGAYGAGPTRDMRRAYYTPMLLALQQNVELGQKGFFSTKLSGYVNQFADSLDSLNLSKSEDSFYSQDNPQINFISGIVKVSEREEQKTGNFLTNSSSEKSRIKENAGFRIFAVNPRKQNKNYFCDLGILLNFGNFSRHNFLPQEARDGSPLHGPLSLAMNGKENLMQGPIKELYSWLNNCFDKFKKVTGFFPLSNYRIFPMVHVDNS